MIQLLFETKTDSIRCILFKQNYYFTCTLLKKYSAWNKDDIRRLIPMLLVQPVYKVNALTVINQVQNQHQISYDWWMKLKTAFLSKFQKIWTFISEQHFGTVPNNGLFVSVDDSFVCFVQIITVNEKGCSI